MIWFVGFIGGCVLIIVVGAMVGMLLDIRSDRQSELEQISGPYRTLYGKVVYLDFKSFEKLYVIAPEKWKLLSASAEYQERYGGDKYRCFFGFWDTVRYTRFKFNLECDEEVRIEKERQRKICNNIEDFLDAMRRDIERLQDTDDSK